MTSTALLLVTLTGPIVPADMAGLVSERLGRLDRMVVDVTVEVYGVHSEVAALDREQWSGPLSTYPYRLTIVRPNVRAEFLKDEPALGYEPVVASVFNGTHTSRHVRPDASGRISYRITPGVAESGVLLWNPILQVFDIHMYETTIPQLNIVDLLRNPNAVCVRCTGGVCTYAVSVPMDGYEYTVHYQFDVNERGMPLRVKCVLDYDDPQHPPVTYEQFVLDAAQVAGVEFPVEVAVTATNPKIPRYHNVYMYRIDDVELADDLTADDIAIDIERRNANIIEYRLDGTAEQTIYDSSGQVIGTEQFYPTGIMEIESERFQRGALGWRKLIPLAALLVGASTALALAFVGRRAARGRRCAR